MKMKIKMRIRNDFITGVAIILPLTITVLVLNLILGVLNRTLLNPIASVFERYIEGFWAAILAKFIIFVIIVAGITGMGAAARIILVRKFFGFWETLLLKVPVMNKIYVGTKQISKAFIGEGRTIFKKVALVEYPRKGMYSIAFLTSEGRKELSDKAGRELMNLFLPTTPNPTSGFFIAVPREEVIFLDMSIEDAFKIIISGGAV